MSLQRLFVDQTTDAIVVASGTFDGVFQVEIIGVLGAATFFTEIQSNLDPSVWIPIADGTWPSSVTDAPAYAGQDGALIAIVNSNVRFRLSGADMTTSISASISNAS